MVWTRVMEVWWWRLICICIMIIYHCGDWLEASISLRWRWLLELKVFLQIVWMKFVQTWYYWKEGCVLKNLEKGSKFKDCLDKHCVNLRIIWMRVMAVWGWYWTWVLDMTIYRGWARLEASIFLQWCWLVGW